MNRTKYSRIQRFSIVVTCLLIPCHTVVAQSELERLRQIPAFKELQDVADATKRRLADESRSRNRLDRPIDCFIVKNCPLYHVLHGIRALGINVCHEAVIGDHEWYVDPDGVVAFATDQPITLELTGTSGRKILDAICEADTRYSWTHDANLGLVVLAPRKDSRLDFFVGRVSDKGNPVDVLGRIDRTSKMPPLAPAFNQGYNNLPDIVLDTPRCSATELLNKIVAQHPGMTWGFRGRASFNYSPHSSAEAVRIEYPRVSKEKSVNSEWRYAIAELLVNNVLTVTVEKRPRVILPGADQLDKARVVPQTTINSHQNDTRTQEQNVVASRLAGSWKLEPALTERLTGKAMGPGSMVFVADPEVEKKVPAKFLEAVKKEGLTIDIRMAGYVELGNGKFPFILTSVHGNPHIFYFRERDGDPWGDSESFNVMLAPARDREKDLLFIGGDFNNQPFRAYERAPEKK